MNKTKRWLDLELRKDPDDLFALLYALESTPSVDVVSIDSPSTLELVLLNKLKEIYNVNFDVVITGEHSAYDSNLDVNPIITEMFNLETGGNLPFTIPLNDYIFISDLHVEADKCRIEFFGGGSLVTLATLIDKAPNKITKAVVQGGFAGVGFAGEENTLRKFKKRKGDAVPSWNLNLNLEASKKVVTALGVSISFVSKNICHDSWIYHNDVADLKTNSIFIETLKRYLKFVANQKKCMHDLLAYMSLDTPNLITSKPVNLQWDDSTPTKWSSISSPSKKHQISISFDKERYISLIRQIGAS